MRMFYCLALLMASKSFAGDTKSLQVYKTQPGCARQGLKCAGPFYTFVGDERTLILPASEDASDNLESLTFGTRERFYLCDAKFVRSVVGPRAALLDSGSYPVLQVFRISGCNAQF